jgi:hypothetical protein
MSKTNKSNQLFPMGNLCADWTVGDTYAKRIKMAAAWCAERHLVYVRKSQGLEKPWSLDPILQSYRFTNVYRELDRVTEEIMAEWVRPQLTNPNIGLIALSGRLINYTNTLVKMRDAGFVFERKPNSERLFKLFNEIRSTKEQLVTGAYICNTIFPKGHPKVDGSKADYIANYFVPLIYTPEHRKDIAEAVASKSFTSLLSAYQRVHGIGKFIANQAAVDLTYTGHITKDIEGSWSPGPGTIKGIRRITQNFDLTAGTEEMDRALSKYQEDLNHELSKHPRWSPSASKMKTHLVPVSTPNCSNTLCEISKHLAMVTGERNRMKNTYKGS